MNGQEYEMLIRRAFSSGREPVIGADADLYRRMTDKSSPGFSNIFSEVRINVRSAIERVIERKRHVIQREELSKLEKMIMTLRTPGFDNRVELDAIIVEAESLFASLGLLPG